MPTASPVTAIAKLSEGLIALEDKYGAHNYQPLDVVISRATGAWMYDSDGRRYLDFLAAYSAVNQGHCHPAILSALIEQAQKVTLTSRAFRNELTEEHQTHGGVNEQVLQCFTAAGVFTELEYALDGVLARLVAGRPK